MILRKIKVVNVSLGVKYCAVQREIDQLNRECSRQLTIRENAAKIKHVLALTCMIRSSADHGHPPEIKSFKNCEAILQ